MLGWGQIDLATASNIGITTIRRLEANDGPVGGTVETLIRIQTALEKAGIIFIPADEQGDVGVRLAKRRLAMKPDNPLSM